MLPRGRPLPRLVLLVAHTRFGQAMAQLRKIDRGCSARPVAPASPGFQGLDARRWRRGSGVDILERRGAVAGGPALRSSRWAAASPWGSFRSRCRALSSSRASGVLRESPVSARLLQPAHVGARPRAGCIHARGSRWSAVEPDDRVALARGESHARRRRARRGEARKAERQDRWKGAVPGQQVVDLTARAPAAPACSRSTKRAASAPSNRGPALWRIAAFG